MKKNWLSLLAILGMLVALIISSVTPVMASESPNSELSTIKTSTTTTAKLSMSAIVLGSTVSDGAQLSYSNSSTGVYRPKPAGTFTFQVQKVSTTPGVAYRWVTFYTVNLNSSSNLYYSIPYSPMSAGTYLFRAIYSGDNYYMGSTSFSSQLRVNPAASTTTTNLSSSSIKVGSVITQRVTVQGLSGLFPAPTGRVDFQVKYTLLSPWITYSSNVILISGTAYSTYKPAASGNWYFRAVYSGDANYKNSQSASKSLSVTIR